MNHERSKDRRLGMSDDPERPWLEGLAKHLKLDIEDLQVIDEDQGANTAASF